VRFALMTEPQMGLTYADQLAVVRRAEAAGFETFFRSDHYESFPGETDQPTTDAWAVLAGLARDTSRIGLGVLVSPVTFRTPGSLAKMAQDVILLAQSEVSELSESGDSTRGGSSTMPQKNNPIISELIITAARTNASLLASMHQAQVQEHERGTHGWQMEWLVLPQMFTLTAAALNKALFLSQNLAVDEVRMHQNVTVSNGLMLAEAVSYALVKASMSRASANQLVKEACQVVAQEGRHLIDVMKEKTDAPVDWDAIREESSYLGSANTFIDRVLQAALEKQNE